MATYEIRIRPRQQTTASLLPPGATLFYGINNHPGWNINSTDQDQREEIIRYEDDSGPLDQTAFDAEVMRLNVKFQKCQADVDPLDAIGAEDEIMDSAALRTYLQMAVEDVQSSIDADMANVDDLEKLKTRVGKLAKFTVLIAKIAVNNIERG